MRRGWAALLAMGALWAVPTWAQEPAPGEREATPGAEQGGDAPSGGLVASVQRGGRNASGECVISVEQDILAPDHERPRQPDGEDPGDTPWEGTRDTPEPPSFLDTTDRRLEDDRPPPTPQQVEALVEMEAEVERFASYGQSYQDTVISLLRREYQRQRRGRNQWYGRQIREEEHLLDQTRDRAIQLFERFIRTYPDDPTYSPDAMFRLGELYFERSAIQFQKEYEAARESGGETPLAADFTPTIELYQRVVRKFPDYERRDGIYYLIGYTLNEMGKAGEARVAWLNLVCGNKFDYDPDTFAVPPPPEDAEAAAEEERADRYPSLTLDEPTPGIPDPDEPFTDPYEGCRPVVEGARFLSETWFRIGEYHFDDYGNPHSLDLSISAYNKILEDPEDRNYNLALYKVAWAYYRASRYPEAIEYFSKLVEWSDRQLETTGRVGSELRPEAIQYLGIAFAYDDWNENQVPDAQEGMPTVLERIQDPKLLPQDRSWTAEVYFQVGQVLFDEAKYPQAIAVWRLSLERWPMHHEAPEIKNMVARAHQRHNEFEKAIAARAELSDYAEGSDWWNRNVDHPAAQRRAEELSENSLIGTAIYYHQQAQTQRRQCVAKQEPQLCQFAEESYALAGQAYREYLERYPNNPQAYELQYNLADALYWSGDYEEAAVQYAAVRDSNLDDAHLSESARRVVESLQRLVERAEEEGRLVVRREPPEPAGSPSMVCPIEMPKLLQRLAQARQMYVARVSKEDDTEGVLEAYDYNNALALYVYGYWKHARERFERIFAKRCKGPQADETGRVAWYNLNNMAVALNDTAGVQRWSSAIEDQACTFGESDEMLAEIDCDKREFKDDPRCLAKQQLTNIEFLRALKTFEKAEQSSGDEQRALYETAATRLVQAVNKEPNHPEAPIALEMAATALERTSRFDSAAQLYQRIIDEVGPREGDTPEEQEKLDTILANAYFRLAYNANRFFDFERAVENYRLLADSRRFTASQQKSIREKREDALINAAIILENLQQYPRASEYYQRAADSVSDADLKRRAYYRLAEVAFKQKAYGKAIRAMRDFISRYRNDAKAGELVVQAHWRIAQSYEALRQARDHKRALEDVVQSFKQTGLAPGSLAAEHAARAKFLLTNEGLDEFEKFAVKPGSPATMEVYVNTIKQQIDDGSREAKQRGEAFNAVLEYRRPTWTIASFVQQGRTYEILARAVLDTPFILPADMQKQLRGLDQFARDDIKFQVEDRIRAVLDSMVRPIECLGVARYALAARAARAGSIDNEWTRTAIDRLQAYGDERIAECIADAQKEMSNLAAYQPGEFRRAPMGQHMSVDRDVGPPPLAGEAP
jgi:cellulose synthase operon protein C